LDQTLYPDGGNNNNNQDDVYHAIIMASHYEIEKRAVPEEWPLHKYVFFFLQLSAITQTTLDRHSSYRRHQSMAR